MYYHMFPALFYDSLFCQTNSYKTKSFSDNGIKKTKQICDKQIFHFCTQ